jgi:hypothetical protein
MTLDEKSDSISIVVNNAILDALDFSFNTPDGMFLAGTEFALPTTSTITDNGVSIILYPSYYSTTADPIKYTANNVQVYDQFTAEISTSLICNVGGKMYALSLSGTNIYWSVNLPERMYRTQTATAVAAVNGPANKQMEIVFSLLHNGEFVAGYGDADIIYGADGECTLNIHKSAAGGTVITVAVFYGNLHKEYTVEVEYVDDVSFVLPNDKGYTLTEEGGKIVYPLIPIDSGARVGGINDYLDLDLKITNDGQKIDLSDVFNNTPNVIIEVSERNYQYAQLIGNRLSIKQGAPSGDYLEISIYLAEKPERKIELIIYFFYPAGVTTFNEKVDREANNQLSAIMTTETLDILSGLKTNNAISTNPIICNINRNSDKVNYSNGILSLKNGQAWGESIGLEFYVSNAYKGRVFASDTDKLIESISLPYYIYDAAQLNKIRENTQAAYYLKSNIIISSGWIAIPSFSGIFDGNFKSITLVSSRANGSGAIGGLFDVLESGGVIKNIDTFTVTLTLPVTTQDNYGDFVGGIVGINNGTVIGINLITGYISAPRNDSGATGGVAGVNNQNISWISNNTLTISAYGDTGGYVGRNYHNVYMVSFSGTIDFYQSEAYTNRSAGGIVGWNTSTGGVTSIFAGGIVNYSNGNDSNSMTLAPALGIVIGANSAGGIYDGTNIVTGSVNSGRLRTATRVEKYGFLNLQKRTIYHDQYEKARGEPIGIQW